jgi:hypothetical protein
MKVGDLVFGPSYWPRPGRIESISEWHGQLCARIIADAGQDKMRSWLGTGPFPYTSPVQFLRLA